LGEFDGQSRLVGSGVVGENIEDQLGAVDDFGFDCFFEVASLSWTEVIIEDDDIGIVEFDELFKFGNFTFPEIGFLIGADSLLHNASDNFCSSGFRQAREFIERVGWIGMFRAKHTGDDANFFGGAIHAIVALHDKKGLR
jgi:hypothetical protein